MNGSRRTGWMAGLLLACAAAAPRGAGAVVPKGDVSRVVEEIAAGVRAGGLDVKTGGEPGVGPDELVVSAGRVELVRLRVRDLAAPGDPPGNAHVHVVSRFAGAPPEGLDACLYGRGDTRGEALRTAAIAFTQRALPPVLASVREEASTTALRFGGDEPYAVPGFRGLAGPLVSWSRGVPGAEVEAALARGRIFGGLQPRELPADGKAHLLKVVALVKDGAWSRTLELDGAPTSVSGDRWAGVPVPGGPVMIVRFAVFHERDTRERGELRTAARARLKAREPWLFTGETCPSRLVPAKLSGSPFADRACTGGRLAACLDECRAGSGPSCYDAASELEQDRAAAEEEWFALYVRACKLGVASGCTNAAAFLTVKEQARKPLPAGATPACGWDAFEPICDRSGDAWGCCMLGSALAEGTHLRRDPARARAALARACAGDEADPACTAARRILQQLDAPGAKRR